MRSDSLLREVDVSQELPTSTFTIQGNAKMFAILADKLYSDKPRAVIREISCNALDAHGMNGQTEPFIISMPNHIEPMLVIRDFGPGMTDDEVMHVYTSFGASTKDQDNDAIGGFGLGCKSPFAYSDAFTVAVWQEGVKRTYAAFRGPDGIPQMSRVSEEESDEPTGVEVRVPVKRADWSDFAETAADVLQYFPAGSFNPVGFEVEVQEYARVAETYRVRQGRYHNAVALMGPVAYPLDWDLVLKEGDKKLPDAIVPIFQIGELDLLPSREGLSYDVATKEKIRQRYLDIAGSLADDMYEQIKDLPHVQQLKLITEFKDAGTWDFVEKRFTTTELVVDDKGQPVIDQKTNKQVEKKTFTGFPGIAGKIELPPGILVTRVEMACSWSQAKDPKIEVTSSRQQGPAELEWRDLERGFFIFDDLPDLSEGKRRVSTRLRRHMKASGLKSVHYYIFDKSRLLNPATVEQIRNGQVEKEVFGYIEDINGPDDIKPFFPGWDEVEDRVLNLSDLELPEAVRPVRDPNAPRKKTELARVLGVRPTSSGYYSYYRNTIWTEQTGTFEGGVYVPLINYELENDDRDRPWFAYRFAQDAGTVLGLSKKARKAIKDDGNEADFVLLGDYIEARYKDARQHPDVLTELGRRVFVETLKQDEEFQRAFKTMQGAPKLFPAIAAEMKRVDEPDSSVQDLIQGLEDYCRRKKVKMPKPAKFKSNIVRLVKREVARSPLLRCAIHSRHSGYNLLSNLSGREDDVAALVKLSRK